jgi:hypothetical protein
MVHSVDLSAASIGYLETRLCVKFSRVALWTLATAGNSGAVTQSKQGMQRRCAKNIRQDKTLGHSAIPSLYEFLYLQSDRISRSEVATGHCAEEGRRAD